MMLRLNSTPSPAPNSLRDSLQTLVERLACEGGLDEVRVAIGNGQTGPVQVAWRRAAAVPEGPATLVTHLLTRGPRLVGQLELTASTGQVSPGRALSLAEDLTEQILALVPAA